MKVRNWHKRTKCREDAAEYCGMSRTHAGVNHAEEDAVSVLFRSDERGRLSFVMTPEEAARIGKLLCEHAAAFVTPKNACVTCAFQQYECPQWDSEARNMGCWIDPNESEGA